MRAPLKATRLYDKDAFWSEPGPAAGSYFISEGGTQIHFVCPCGCDQHRILRLNGLEPSWTYDGNIDAPTLTPSMRDRNVCGWHGFLTAGMWVFCDDSGPVPIPTFQT